MNLPLIAALLTLLLLLVLSQVYWFRAAWRRIRRVQTPWMRHAWQVVYLLFAAVLLLVIADRLSGRLLPRPPGQWVVMFAQLWFLPSAAAFALLKLVHLAGRIWRRLSPPPPAPAAAGLPRRQFLRYAAGAAAALPFTAGLYGFAQVRLRYRVHELDAPIPGLPAALDGLRIAQLSDIHAGDFMPPAEIARVAERVNLLQPHLIALTGDYVTGPRDPLDACIAALAGLHAPLGVWACNGNHEIYAGVEERARRLFAARGMNLLRQENAVIGFQGAAFNLIGVDYQRTPRDMHQRGVTPGPMLNVIEPLVRHDMPNILLSHNPNSFPRAAQLGIELSLAGHTHGGQIQVEILERFVSPARFITPFIAGLYDLPCGTAAPGCAPQPESVVERRSLLYVNRGLGTIAIPARLGADPELTLLTLRRA